MNQTTQSGIERDNCGICLEPINMSENVVILECTHDFHLTCIIQYNNTTVPNKVCPICRGNSCIFTEETNENLERKVDRISRHYRESLLAIGQIINGDLLYKDRVYICKTMVDRYMEIMYEDIEDDEAEEEMTAAELVDVIMTNEARIVGTVDEQ